MADRLAPFTARVDRCARALELNGADADTFARVAGPDLKNELLEAGRAAFGADLKPWKNKGARASTGYDVDTTGRGVTLTFKLRPAGVWVFGEQGAGPHLIGGGRNYRRGTRPSTSRRRTSKASTRRYVKGAGYRYFVAVSVLHPGTKGKKAIKYAFKRFRTTQRAAAEAGVRAVIRKATQ